MRKVLFALLLAAAPALQAAEESKPAADEAKPAAEAAAPSAEAPAAEKAPEAKEEAKAAKKEKSPADSWSEDQKTLYSLGVMLGAQVSTLGLKEPEVKLVVQGLRDAVMEKKPVVDPGEYRTKIGELGRARMAEKAEVRKKKDKAYWDKASKEKGAEVLASGLIYTQLKKGKGDAPKAEDKVKASYEGKLIDGTVFDASAKHGGPIEFPLSGVVRCWTEGLQKMKPGGKARLVCPSDIAYGDMGRPPVIPGGATLVFEVELVEVVKK